MRSLAILPALVAVAAAQTTEPCAQIADLVVQQGTVNPIIDAELAYKCLQTVPIDKTAASKTIDSIKQYAQMQSTIAFLKNPPKGYTSEAVDIMGGLDNIKSKVNNGEYKNEYDFENDIASLIIKAHDGHFSFEGMAYSGVFRWRRDRKVALIASSNDGKEAPKIWTVADANSTGGYTPSAVSKINGKDAAQFLKDESELLSFHDPDARFNYMFYMQPAGSMGAFMNPKFYPGPSVEVTYENSTTNKYTNQAVIVDYSKWTSITDGPSFYTAFVDPASATKSKRSEHNHDPRPVPVQEDGLSRRSIPDGYPEPVIQHSATNIELAGYFIGTSAGNVGVLVVQQFATATGDEAREFQSVVQSYISNAKSRNVKKHIIDVRTNGGGKLLLGYDMYLQFFPSQKPQLMSRYRATQTVDVWGTKLSNLVLASNNGGVYTSPFNYHSYLNKDYTDYKDWKDMYGPATFNSDTFTNLLRYNLSDPLVTSDERYGLGITIMGFGTGVLAASSTDPFNASDIVIFSDGVCASTCSLFTELMVQQSGVKTIAVGGRPSTGPMQAVGGTKGTLLLQASYLQDMTDYMSNNFAADQKQKDEWATFMPSDFSIRASAASVNFHDNIRKGLENDGTPTQFYNDSASCRIYYQPKMYFNVTETWTRVAEAAFGKDGGLDRDKCVPGSVTSKEEQTGGGVGNPTTTNPGNNNNNNGNTGTPPSPTPSKKGAASVSGPRGWAAVVVCGAVVLVGLVLA